VNLFGQRVFEYLTKRLPEIPKPVRSYRTLDINKEIAKSQTVSFIETNSHCLHRTCVQGHLMEKICFTAG
jgi:hypothetical protein